jgi:hypothetical protein
MQSQKAWYWLAAGVLALGLNGAYQDGQLGWVHCLADRVAGSIERVSERGVHFVTMAEVMLGRSPGTFSRTEAALQKIQSKAACARVARVQRQVAMAQVRQQLAEADIQRKMDLARMKMDTVRAITIDRTNRFRDCPGFSKVVVDMADMPNIDISNLPDIQMSDIPEIDLGARSGSNGPI